MARLTHSLIGEVSWWLANHPSADTDTVAPERALLLLVRDRPAELRLRTVRGVAPADVEKWLLLLS